MLRKIPNGSVAGIISSIPTISKDKLAKAWAKGIADYVSLNIIKEYVNYIDTFLFLKFNFFHSWESSSKIRSPEFHLNKLISSTQSNTRERSVQMDQWS